MQQEQLTFFTAKVVVPIVVTAAVVSLSTPAILV